MIQQGRLARWMQRSKFSVAMYQYFNHSMHSL